MITDSYHLWAISLPNATWITEFSDVTPSMNAKYIDGFSPGGLVPDFRGGHGLEPRIDFSTPQLKTILDACGLDAYDASGGNVDLYYQKDVNLGTRLSENDESHLRLRYLRSMLTWDRITASQGSTAEISCSLVPTFLANVPLTPETGVPMPSNAALGSEYFGLGPVKCNGDFIGGISDNTLALGAALNTQAADGEDFPSFAGIGQMNPMITPTTASLENWEALGVDGVLLTSWSCYFRRKKPDLPISYADGDQQHIKFSGGSGLWTIDSSSGGLGAGPAAAQLRIAPRRGAPSDIHVMSLSTASAIT
jgi:hypothetical protein